MLETSARLLRLLSLFQGRRYWSGADLADRLEVTTRTLRRDVDKLRSLGYPIHSTTGTEGGYQLGAGTSMPPLLLDDDEAVAVALGLRSAATGAIQGIEEASVRALSKIEQILPPRLARRVATLQSMIVTPTGTSAYTPPVDINKLSAIASACRDNETLRFRYSDHGGKASSRNVEPHRLVNLGGRRWYLVAWDTDRNDWRTFRMDRIENQPSSGIRFAPRDPPATDLAAYVSQGIAYAPPCRARIKLFVAAETVASFLPPGTGMVEPIDEQTCMFETGAATYESLAMHLVLLNCDFEVTAPAELIEEIRKFSKRYQRSIPATGDAPISGLS
jgi:predicted DNA-binding transcriptional regulator YafY